MNKIILGFISGSIIFWIYGFSVDPNIFITEHIRHHFWDRILHINALGYDHYPTIIELWRTFCKNSGYLFMFMSAISVSFLLCNMRRKGRDKSIFPIWCIVGAIIFSIIDWRQTVHLSLIMPALLISVFLFTSMQRSYIKIICFSGLLFCLIRNMLLIPEAITNYNVLM